MGGQWGGSYNKYQVFEKPLRIQNQVQTLLLPKSGLLLSFCISMNPEILQPPKPKAAWDLPLPFHLHTKLKTCLAAAAAKRLSRVQLGVTPEMPAHQAPPSLGFSRQEHWSGLPFPSPMH